MTNRLWGCRLTLFATLVGCAGSTAAPEPPAPVEPPVSEPCVEVTKVALAKSKKAVEGGFLDRSGRMLEASRAECPAEAELVEALADVWLDQGRLAKVAALLDAADSPFGEAARASGRARLADAKKRPRDADALLVSAREATVKGDAALARRLYDQALAVLSATLGKTEGRHSSFSIPRHPILATVKTTSPTWDRPLWRTMERCDFGPC